MKLKQSKRNRRYICASWLHFTSGGRGSVGMGTSPSQMANCLCFHDILSCILILNIIVASSSLDRLKQRLQVTSNYCEDACGTSSSELESETL